MNMKKTIAAVAAATVAVSAIATTTASADLTAKTLNYNLVEERAGLTNTVVTITARLSSAELVKGGMVVVSAMGADVKDLITVSGNYFDNGGNSLKTISAIKATGNMWSADYTKEGADLMVYQGGGGAWDVLSRGLATQASPSDPWVIINQRMFIPVVGTGEGTATSLVESKEANLDVTVTYNSLDTKKYGGVDKINDAITNGDLGIKVEVYNPSHDVTATAGSSAVAGDPTKVVAGAATLAGTRAAVDSYQIKAGGTDTTVTSTAPTLAAITPTIAAKYTGGTGDYVFTYTHSSTSWALTGGASASNVTLADYGIDYTPVVGDDGLKITVTFTAAAQGTPTTVSETVAVADITLGTAAKQTIADYMQDLGMTSGLNITGTYNSGAWTFTCNGNAIGVNVNTANVVGYTPADGDTITIPVTYTLATSAPAAGGGHTWGGSTVTLGGLVQTNNVVKNGVHINGSISQTPEYYTYRASAPATADYVGGNAKVTKGEYRRAPFKTNTSTAGLDNESNIIYYLEHHLLNSAAPYKPETTAGTRRWAENQGFSGTYGYYTNVAAVLNDAVQNYDVTFTFNTATSPVYYVNDGSAKYGTYETGDTWLPEVSDEYMSFGQQLYPLYDLELTTFTGMDWAGINLFAGALVINGGLTMSLSDTQYFDWTKTSISFSWDDIVDAAASKGITSDASLYIRTLGLVTSKEWFWDSMNVELALKEADDASADAGIDADDDVIDDEDIDDGEDVDFEDEEPETPAETEAPAVAPAVAENPKTGNASVALAVIPVALAAAAVVAKKRG